MLVAFATALVAVSSPYLVFVPSKLAVGVAVDSRNRHQLVAEWTGVVDLNPWCSKLGGRRFDSPGRQQ